MRKLVTKSEQVAANIQRFVTALPESREMQSRLGQVHDWYAFRESNDGWLFGPSKFVGYRDNTIEKYLQTYRVGANGGETERALQPLSSPVEVGSRQERELTAALEAFLDQWGRKMRRESQIRIVAEETSGTRIVSKRKLPDGLLARISSDPDICGGRPCVKGTRMRVLDIVEAIAHGATRKELLADFDYIADEDITAALLYAAHATDHRVLRTI